MLLQKLHSHFDRSLFSGLSFTLLYFLQKPLLDILIIQIVQIPDVKVFQQRKVIVFILF